MHTQITIKSTTPKKYEKKLCQALLKIMNGNFECFCLVSLDKKAKFNRDKSTIQQKFFVFISFAFNDFFDVFIVDEKLVDQSKFNCCLLSFYWCCV